MGGRLRGSGFFIGSEGFVSFFRRENEKRWAQFKDLKGELTADLAELMEYELTLIYHAEVARHYNQSLADIEARNGLDVEILWRWMQLIRHVESGK